jgi:tRNA nucleotidyltransferase (CCA-adding enzyme)
MISQKKFSPATLKKVLAPVLKKYPLVTDIVDAINKQKGSALLIGGAVRDILLGIPVKDLDIEVHHITLTELEDILKQFGRVSLVGKSFGVLRLHGLDIDWSLPRTDSSGRKPQVTIDPNMSFEQAFKRRDLTINAMGIDLVTFNLIDPFGGQEDLAEGILRAPDRDLFIEDPLRFFRVMQFIGRFEMVPDATLNKLCKKMDISTVSNERIEAEFEKLLLKSKKPSLAIEWLNEIGRLAEILPEVAATRGVRQNPEYHPEGDVFEHTKQALDAAAESTFHNPQDKLVLMYAALCHDLGKVTTTKKIKGTLRSYGHDQAGAPLAKSLLKHITRKKDIIDTVALLVRYHMSPLQFTKANSSAAAYKRLATKLAPYTNLAMLAELTRADWRGRNAQKNNPLPQKTFAELEKFLQNAQDANVLLQAEQPILLGRDLMPDVEPGPRMGKLLKAAYEIQIEEGVADKKILKKRVLAGKKK